MESNLQSSLQTRRGFIRQALCAAVGTTALTNTIRDLRFINAAMAQTSGGISDYKALICIFLNGGNDANNLFIPTIPAEWANYAAIRTPVLAIPNTDGSGATALALNSLSNDGHNYGLHPACPELAALFNAGKMAPVFNVGTLVYPLTKAQYSSGSVPQPPQLFSHADQQVQWQTSIPDRLPTTGWGGRCADLLDQYNPKNGNADVLSMAISLAGSNTFEVGGVVQQYGVSPSGVVSLNSALGPSSAQAARTTALNNLLGIDAIQANMLTQNYSLALQHALASGSGLSTSLTNSRALNLLGELSAEHHRAQRGRDDHQLKFVQPVEDGGAHHRRGVPHRRAGRAGDEAADFLLPGGWVRHAHGPDEQRGQRDDQQRGGGDRFAGQFVRGIEPEHQQFPKRDGRRSVSSTGTAPSRSG